MIFAAKFEVNVWLFGLGVIAMVIAWRLGTLAARTIPLKTLVGLPELEPGRNIQPLLRSGIYSRTRNPVYVTHWLVILAFAAWSGYLANWALFALDGILMPLMIRAEEKELLQRYGPEFEAYMQSVPRFFSRLTW